jgi:outer membrane protein OmpA-like peptidoglycan-associated protein
MNRIAPLAVLVPLLLAGCATENYVNGEVTKVNQRVDGVEANLGQMKGKMETGRGEVNAALAAHDARLGKTEAGLAAVGATAQDALDRANAAGKLAAGKLLYQVTLSEDKLRYASGGAELTPDALVVLDEFASKLKGENRNVFVEIQGHTDGTGATDYNHKLGLERAEAVRRHLYSQGLALHRIGTISFGETVPIADNRTREGRAANRRVVLVVLE